MSYVLLCVNGLMVNSCYSLEHKMFHSNYVYNIKWKIISNDMEFICKFRVDPKRRNAI